jgi:hypothetical protein
LGQSLQQGAVQAKADKTANAKQGPDRKKSAPVEESPNDRSSGGHPQSSNAPQPGSQQPTPAARGRIGFSAPWETHDEASETKPDSRVKQSSAFVDELTKAGSTEASGQATKTDQAREQEERPDA